MNDDGFTTLPGGRRIRKSDPLICALGALDELNAALGLLRVLLAGHADAALIESLQKQILALGGELATGQSALGREDVAVLEQEAAWRETRLPPLQHFVLPGTNEHSARAHWARAVCRRAERELVRAQESSPERVSAPALAWLNRLSSLLFTWARSTG